MNEIWKDIEGYEGIYQVSNLGNVRSLGNGKTHKSERILKQGTTLGYKTVILCKDGITSSKRVHRLVAEAFIKNPQNFDIVNHKDENKTNNCVENLEWCTMQYNTNYGTGVERRSSKRKKPIKQLDMEGNLIRLWDSATDAAKYFGKSRGTAISNCCNGISDSSYGYRWCY